MLPDVYRFPAAIILVLGGAVACFAGYRLFKVVLGIFGFILGALIASSVFGDSARTAMVFAAIGGGIVGALLLIGTYFVGVALVGAGSGALLASLVWGYIEGDPHPLVVILFSIAGALLATWLQRYVIIGSTAFGGAWTMLAGVLAIEAGRRSPDAAAGGAIWVAYPLNPAPGTRWLPWAWLALGLAGVLVQVYVTARPGGRVSRPFRKKRKR